MADDGETPDNVVVLRTITKLDVPPDRVLSDPRGKLSMAIVIGETIDGEFYFASSLASGPETLWAIERAKRQLLSTVESD